MIDKEARTQERLSRKEQTCSNFNGIQNKTCKAGVCYREKQTGPEGKISFVLKCLPRMSERITLPQFECEHFRMPTPEEIAADEAEFQAVIDQFTKVMPVVNEWRNKPPRGKAEVIDCPICGGRLHLSQAASNGHVHGKCETPKCVSFME